MYYDSFDGLNEDLSVGCSLMWHLVFGCVLLVEAGAVALGF